LDVLLFFYEAEFFLAHSRLEQSVETATSRALQDYHPKA
jgi:hypothetical protein